MKTTESKSSSSPAVQRSNATPFFQPEESREGFFSSKQSHEPFFQPAAPLDNNPKPHNPQQTTIQTKLSIGAPDDQYEQEADSMADKVVQKLASSDDGASVRRKCTDCAKDDAEAGIAPKLRTKSIFESNEEPANERVQRTCEACATETTQPLRIQRMEEEEPELQAKGGAPGLQASSDLESRLNTTKGSGSPLPDDTRSSMESSFGTDFSGVRVHTNNSAVQMNQELGAQAFTHGSDIYFNSGKYDTGSSDGQRLLAHELTHTVQQGGASQQINQQSNPNIPAIQLTEESDLIGQHTTLGFLDERQLGGALLSRARRGNFTIVSRVLDELGSTDRDDVAYEMMRQTNDQTITQFVQSSEGRQMLDRLYDELSAGSFAEEERTQANRIIDAKHSTIQAASHPQDLSRIKKFPFKLPGITVFNDAPITAERRGQGRVWVEMPTRVLGTDMFRAETQTLPTEVFISGIEIPENEIIGVRMYDLGGELHIRPALYLVQLANETNTQVLQSMAEAAAIGLTLGTGALAAGAAEGSAAVGALVRLGVSAERAARVVLLADRAAFTIGLIATTLRDHRGWIIERFGDRGRRFLDYVDFTHRMVAIYGMARFVFEMGGLLSRLRTSNSSWRQASSSAESELSSSQRQAVQDINRHTDEFLDNANQIESSRNPSSTGSTTGTTRELPEAPEPTSGSQLTRPVAPSPSPPVPIEFPPSTAASEAAARRVLEILEGTSVQPPPRGTALGVFHHQDGSVTIAPAGGADRVSAVSQALAGRIPPNWRVAPPEISPTDVHPEGLRPWTAPSGQIRPGRPTCAECRLSVGGRTNPSPVEGMTVLQWGGGGSTLRFTVPETGIMRPCESCAINADRIMEPIRVVPRPPASESQ